MPLRSGPDGGGGDGCWAGAGAGAGAGAAAASDAAGTCVRRCAATQVVVSARRRRRSRPSDADEPAPTNLVPHVEHDAERQMISAVLPGARSPVLRSLGR